jgi:hypothetical protein
VGLPLNKSKIKNQNAKLTVLFSPSVMPSSLPAGRQGHPGLRQQYSGSPLLETKNGRFAFRILSYLSLYLSREIFYSQKKIPAVREFLDKYGNKY